MTHPHADIEKTVTTLWHRGLSTYDIADRTRMKEAEVCRIIARKVAPKKWVPAGDTLKTPRGRTDDIVAPVAERHGVTIQQVISRSRRQKIVTARHEAMAAVYLARPEWSYPDLGRYFKRDHTSCLYAVHKAAAGAIGWFIQTLSIEWGEPC